MEYFVLRVEPYRSYKASLTVLKGSRTVTYSRRGGGYSLYSDDRDDRRIF